MASACSTRFERVLRPAGLQQHARGIEQALAMRRLEAERGVEGLEGAGVVAGLPGREAEHVVAPGVVGLAFAVRLEHARGLLVAAAVERALRVGVARHDGADDERLRAGRSRRRRGRARRRGGVGGDGGAAGGRSPVVDGRSVREQPAARGTRTLAARTVKWDAERDMGSSLGVAPWRGDFGRWEERQAGGQRMEPLSIAS